MKLIAHRGGSFGKENSLETMIGAAQMGADMVECDIRRTADGVYVIYHDESLSRLAGTDATVSGASFAQMKDLLAQNGQSMITFDELAANYKEKTPILLHIKLADYDEELAKYIVDSGLPVVPGVMSLDMLKCFSAHLPPERILAFLPSEKDAESFYQNGAGIIRLWEQWLGRITPSEVKKACPNAQVFIMACNLQVEPFSAMSLETMNGSIESLEKCQALGADGVLLNHIEMALDWRQARKE